MRARNLVTALVIPIAIAISVGIAVVVAAGANNGPAGLAPSDLAVGFPPARSAATDFTTTPALAGRGISLPLTATAAVGGDIVAAGTQSGGRLARVRFLFSGNDGHSWQLASVQAAAGASAPQAQGPVLLAGGQAGWLGLTPNSSFTSQNGTAWVSHPGLPLRSGDTINALTAAGTGFLAVGQNGPSTGASSPVIWLSPNGTSWQRETPTASALPVAAGSRVVAITHAAANGMVLVISGTVATADGRESATWRSADGGTSWSAVTIPAGTGAALTIAGLAPLKNGFVAVRTAIVNGDTGALVYASRDGVTWTKSAAITTGNGAALTIGQVSGGPAGAVIEGSANGLLIAFLSADGAKWTGTDPFGTPSAEQVGAVAVTSAGQAVIAASASGASAASQPVLTLIGPQGGPEQVVVTAIGGVPDPQVAVNAVAASGAMQVAVGSANGFPATWSSPDGGTTWRRGTGVTAATLDRAGTQQLSAVAHGPAGWVAVGGPTGSLAGGHPVVVSSPSGQAWTAQDGTGPLDAAGLVTSGVAASARGYVIVGWQGSGSHRAPMAWFSSALAGWRAVPLPSAGGDAMVTSVTATSGGFVAVGSAGGKPALWTSANGQAWRGATLGVPGANSASLSLVAASGAAVTAAGTEVTTSGERIPFAEMSANNGATWQSVALPAPLKATAGSVTISALTAAGAGFTATGTFGLAGNTDVVVWTCSPAAGGNAASTGTWTAETPEGLGLSGPGIHAITALTAAGSTLTGAGFTATESGEFPTIWQSPIRS
ncbi:MAG TPA: hypothetical protein VMG38_00385 [Trebonia sp.]|nr:hypothetical protein [Trebonia sp.]